MKTKLVVCLAVASVVLIPTLFGQDTPVLPQPTPVAPLPNVPESVAKTHLIHYVAPAYPPEARRKCVEGVVVLKLLVDETGTVLHTTVLSGSIVLADSTRTAAKQWMYEPYILGGKPVRYETQATEKFRAPQGQCPHHTAN